MNALNFARRLRALLLTTALGGLTACGSGSGTTTPTGIDGPSGNTDVTQQMVDWNNNGIDDAQDILAGTSTDDNNNGIVDEVEIDIDGDGTLDGRILAGRVFEDANWNGVLDGSESGVSSIVVEALNVNGAVVGSDTTDATGMWRLDDVATLQGLHVRFSGWSAPLVPGFGAGTANQFAIGSRADVDLALQQQQFCDTRPTAVYRMAVPCYVSGTRDGDGASLDVIVSYDYDASGEAVPPRSDAVSSEVGSTWGLAFQGRSRRLFAAATIKRHTDLGPQGIGGVYVLDYSDSASASVANQFTLQGVAPANGGAPIDLGVVKRAADAGDDPNDYELPVDPNANSVDFDAFDKVGKASFGDIDVGEDGDTLWLVNLNQIALITVDISDPAVTTPADGVIVNQYPLAGLAGWPACSPDTGVARPYGLKFANGRGYIGVVCTAEGSLIDTDLSAHVLSFDPANVSAGLTSELVMDLNYVRERGGVFGGDPATWHAWKTTWAQTGLPTSGGERTHAQPMLSDIEFADDGAMILGFGDRWGHQTGFSNSPAVMGGIGLFFTSNSGGDIIRVCNVDGTWVVEGDPGADDDSRCPVNDALGGTHVEQLANDGPSGRGEFFYEDHWFNQHMEVTEGGLSLLPGTNEVVASVFDPTTSAFSQGIHWYSTVDGSRTDGYRILGSPGFGFGKAAGLGDLELLCPAAPVEIGSTVFSDNNADGEQNGGDTPLVGVTVTLLCDGSPVATTVTDAQGHYFFNDQNVPDGLTPSQASCYRVCIDLSDPILAGAQPTEADASGVVDELDSDGDAGLVAGAVCIDVSSPAPGLVDHSYDFGFLPVGCIGDRLWYDLNVDGVQDQAGEPGLQGVTLRLCTAGADSQLGTADDVEQASTQTGVDGAYQFTNLPPGWYVVKVDMTTLPPGNYVGSTGATMLPYHLGVNECYDGADIGLVDTYVIGRQVFIDSNENGTYEPQIGEAPIPNVLVVLCDLDAGGTEIASTRTDGHGEFQFTVTPGNYEMKIAQSNFAAGGALANTYATSQPDGTAGAAITNQDDLSHEFGFRRTDPVAVRHFCGWWVDNQTAWPLTQIVVGNQTLSKAEAIEVLSGANSLLEASHSQAVGSVPPTMDVSYALAWALIGAKLNVAAGNNPNAIAQALLDADAWMARNGGILSGIHQSHPEHAEGLALFETLDTWNQGG